MNMAGSDKREFFDIEGRGHLPDEGQSIVFRPGAYVKVRDEQGKVLLIKDRKSGKWELPGGGVETGEMLDEAAIREVREETAYKIALVSDQPVWVETRLSYFTGKHLFVHQIEHLFRGRMIGKEKGVGIVEDEEILAVGWFTDEEIEGLDVIWYHEGYLKGETAKTF